MATTQQTITLTLHIDEAEALASAAAYKTANAERVWRTTDETDQKRMDLRTGLATLRHALEHVAVAASQSPDDRCGTRAPGQG